MPKRVETIPGGMTITRRYEGDGDQSIVVIIRARGNKAKIVEAEVGLRDFAQCVTGLGDVPAVLKVYSPRSVGGDHA
jgi:hypothetical protein